MELIKMPRPRTPKERAEVTGRTKKDPGRFAGRSSPVTGPLGDAPAWLSPGQVAAWEAFRTELPWLQMSDRHLVALACTLQAKLETGEPVGTTELNLLRLCYGMMGASPADRSKVGYVESPEDDPLDHYFN
jgi:hypothetical protein